jgi:hypothetical protein
MPSVPQFDGFRDCPYAESLTSKIEIKTGANMANLALVYGMRLFPSEELGEIKEATLLLKDGRTARVTMHLIEGGKEEIEATLRQSIDAFFDMYPDIV